MGVWRPFYLTLVEFKPKRSQYGRRRCALHGCTAPGANHSLDGFVAARFQRWDTMKLFRALTTVLMACVLLSLPLRGLLLASDSPTYRGWIYVQMALLVIATGLLWQLRRFRLEALFGLAVVSFPITCINALCLNYGNGPAVWIAPVVFWCIYGSAAVPAFRRVNDFKRDLDQP